jgi:5-(carboxyamino)imidazole ribonucleotide synthase
VLDRADDVARDVLDTLSGRGVFGIELFETREGAIQVNEIAPRPHNSGHWTIEGARTSQFEQHVRAVLGWPLGSTRLRSPTVLTNVLGTVDEPRRARLGNVEAVLSDPDASLHWYGKREVRPLRKMGHVTVTDDRGDRNIDDLLSHARDLRGRLRFEPTTD